MKRFTVFLGDGESLKLSADCADQQFADGKLCGIVFLVNGSPVAAFVPDNIQGWMESNAREW